MAEFIGSLHPLLVHLPVGILVLAMFMQLTISMFKYQHLQSAMPFVLLMAALSSTIAWVSGWIMPKNGEFDESLLGIHFWSTTGMTIGSMLLYICFTANKPFLKKGYLPVLVTTILLLTIAGHYGGSITHGIDHIKLIKPGQSKQSNVVSSVDSLLVYSDIVAPILKSKCVSCHNLGKKKGGLLMDTPEGIVHGGKNGVILTSGNSSMSKMIRRIHLPKEVEEHMPPSGKKQLSDHEIILLEWWIDQGASFTDKVASIEQPEYVQVILKNYGRQKTNLDTIGLKIISTDIIHGLINQGIPIIPQGLENALVRVNLSRDTSLTVKKLRNLKKIKANINEIDFSFSNLDDQQMSILSDFKNLQSLKLQGTNITKKGIKHLAGLPALKTLNIYNTSIDNEGAQLLNKIKSLRKLYLWKTQISEEAITELLSKNPLLTIVDGIDKELFGESILPMIIKQPNTNYFSDSMSLKLYNPANESSIYFTIDGSEPDSSKLKFQENYIIRETTLLKAIAYKKGWKPSPLYEKLLIKKSRFAPSISLSNPPSEKYQGKGSATLIDEKFGSTSFKDGSWLGYEARDVEITFELPDESTISKVIIGALEETASYIFFPKSISITTSMEGESYNEIKKREIPIAQGPMPTHYESFVLSFKAHQARFLKIHIEGVLKNPEWHIAPGAPNWVFLDEIIIE